MTTSTTVLTPRVIGPIEREQIAHAAARKRRFAALKPPPPQAPPPRRLLSPFHPARTDPQSIASAGELKEQAAQVAKTIRKMAPWRAILDEVSAAHGVSVAEIMGESRARHIVVARHECCFRLVVECGLSFPGAGRRLQVDHATVMHGVTCHLKRNPHLEASYNEHIAAKSSSRSSRYRDVVRMYFDEDRSVPEIMRETGLDRNMVNSFIRSEVRKVRQVHQGAPAE